MEPWTEKHRPKTLDGVLGNPSAVANLRDWAASWADGPPEKRAAILSGGPGTGKTTAALALAAEMGWDIVELNASDVRNAESVERIVGRAASMQTFGLDGFLSTKHGKRKLILFDEADNLFGSNDRGGAGAIVRVIQSAGQPILLTVNDFYETTRRSPALRSLALKVEFRGVQTGTMVKRLGEICAAEGVSVPPEALKRIAETARGDLRAALNDLQSVAQGLASVDAAAGALHDGRDTIGSEFDATRRILFTQTASHAIEAYQTLDTDPERFILWLDGNIPVLYKGEDLHQGFRALGRADVYLGRARRRQMFALWSYASEMMTAGVAVAKTSKPEFQPLQFPQWLSQMSRSRESRAIRDGASLKLARHLHCSRAEVSESLLPFVKRMVSKDEELAARLTALLELEDAEAEFLTGKAPKEKEEKEEREEGSGETKKAKRGKGRKAAAPKEEKKEEAPKAEGAPEKADAKETKPPRKPRATKGKGKTEQAPGVEEDRSKKESGTPPPEAEPAAPRGKVLKQSDLSKFP